MFLKPSENVTPKSPVIKKILTDDTHSIPEIRALLQAILKEIYS